MFADGLFSLGLGLGLRFGYGYGYGYSYGYSCRERALFVAGVHLMIGLLLALLRRCEDPVWTLALAD